MPRLHTVTTAELRAAMTDAERAALPESVGGVELEAWLGSLVLQACDRIVGAINSCERNARIATGLCKVPAECVRTALVLARHAAISAVPGMGDVLEGTTRASEYATATRDLEALAACELLPLYDLDEEEAADDGGVPSLTLVGTPAHEWLV